MGRAGRARVPGGGRGGARAGLGGHLGLLLGLLLLAGPAAAAEAAAGGRRGARRGALRGAAPAPAARGRGGARARRGLRHVWDVHHHHPPGAPAAAPGGAERIAEAGGGPLGGTDPGWLAAARASGGDLVQAVRQQRARARVVLVGSGTSVLADEYGAGIDTFDTVVRFNKWHIDGYSQFVGTKISEWYINNLDTRLDKQPKKAWAPGFLDLLGDRRHRIPGIKVIVPSSKSKKKVTQALRRYKRIWPLVRFNTFNHNGGLAERIRRKYHFSERFFSMGMIAIAQNLQHPPVVLHGFDFGKGSHGHYWENLRSKETCHNVRGEGFAIQQMEKQGDVVRLKCLMAQTAQEVDAECRVSTLVAPQQNWIGGCTKDNKGLRKDMAGRHNEHEFGTAGLPRPILAPH